MLWLCLSLAQLPLEACLPPSADCVAITDRKASRRWLITCNTTCLELGIEPGQDATAALALHPGLRLFSRSLRHERDALKGIATWAGQFSDFISYDAQRFLLWMEIGSSLRYFGGLESLESRIMSSLQQLGYSAHTGIARTPEAAALIARPGARHIIEESEPLHERLSPLSLSYMPLSKASLSALYETGHRTIGDILALPRDSVARRLGPDTTLYLARLLGEVRHPLKAFRPPECYQRKFEFAGAIESVEGLLFPLKRILGELEGYLRARDTAIQDLEVVFAHAHNPFTTLHVRTTMPVRDAQKLLGLLRERMERSSFAAAVEGVTVCAERFVPLGDTQLELLDTRGQRQQAWAGLIDKLRARLGNDAIHHLGLRDDHRPEKAWCVQSDPELNDVRPIDAARPIWLLPGHPISQPPKITGKPERIEGGWWDGVDISRDYYVAEIPGGSKLWLYKDLISGRWHLQGLWA